MENKRATGSVRCQLCHPNGQIRKGSSTNLHGATHAHHHQPVTSTAIKQTVTEVNSTSGETLLTAFPIIYKDKPIGSCQDVNETGDPPHGMRGVQDILRF